MAYNLSSVEREIGHLKRFIRKLGTQNDKGQYVVTFGVLFDDDEAANTFEAIVGTLKAAKKRKIISFKGQMLLKGAHDNVKITLLKDNDGDSNDNHHDTNRQTPSNPQSPEEVTSPNSPPITVSKAPSNSNDDQKENMIQIAGRCKSAGCKCDKFVENPSKWSKGKCKSCDHPPNNHQQTWIKKSDYNLPADLSPVKAAVKSMKKNRKVSAEKVVNEPKKDEMDNLWGKEFTDGLSDCIGKLFRYDEQSILPRKYILFYLKKIECFDFSGQTKHGDALEYALMTNEQFGKRVVHPYGYNVSLSK